MDWSLARQPQMEPQLNQPHLAAWRQVFNDVSSSYYEGRNFSSMQFNNNRDAKKVKPIGTHGTLTDHAGRPIAVAVYSGHTGDPTTVPEQVTKLHESFGPERVIVVSGHGLLTQTQRDTLKQ